MKRKAKDLEARIAKLLWEAHSYGQMEALAGITDRMAFAKEFTTEETYRDELVRLIRERAERGEI